MSHNQMERPIRDRRRRVTDENENGGKPFRRFLSLLLRKGTCRSGLLLPGGFSVAHHTRGFRSRLPARGFAFRGFLGERAGCRRLFFAGRAIVTHHLGSMRCGLIPGLLVIHSISIFFRPDFGRAVPAQVSDAIPLPRSFHPALENSPETGSSTTESYWFFPK